MSEEIFVTKLFVYSNNRIYSSHSGVRLFTSFHFVVHIQHHRLIVHGVVHISLLTLKVFNIELWCRSVYLIRVHNQIMRTFALCKHKIYVPTPKHVNSMPLLFISFQMKTVTHFKKIHSRIHLFVKYLRIPQNLLSLLYSR